MSTKKYFRAMTLIIGLSLFLVGCKKTASKEDIERDRKLKVSQLQNISKAKEKSRVEEYKKADEKAKKIAEQKAKKEKEKKLAEEKAKKEKEKKLAEEKAKKEAEEKKLALAENESEQDYQNPSYSESENKYTDDYQNSNYTESENATNEDKQTKPESEPIYRVDPLGNSGMEFDTMDEAIAWAEAKVNDDKFLKELFDKGMGGYWVDSLFWSDGFVHSYSVDWN